MELPLPTDFLHGRTGSGCGLLLKRQPLRGLGSFPVHAKIRAASSNEFVHFPGIQSFPGKITAGLQAGCLGSLLLRLTDLLAQEAQQFGVDFFRVCPRDAVWTILHDQQARPFDELGGAQSRSRDGKNAIRIPLNHQRGHIDVGQVLTEIFVPGWDACQAGSGGGAGRYVPTGLDDLFADTLTQQQVRVLEILEEASKERVAVGGHGFLHAGKYTGIQAFGIVAGLEQVRWHTGDNHGFAHALGAVFSDVACHLASAHRKAD